MHKVAIYRRYAYQSPNHRPRWSFVLTILHHVNKHEIVFHNLYKLMIISNILDLSSILTHNRKKI